MIDVRFIIKKVVGKDIKHELPKNPSISIFNDFIKNQKILC